MAVATRNRKSSRKANVRVTRKIGAKTRRILGQGIVLNEPIGEQLAARIDGNKPAKITSYQGAPIAASRLFERKLDQFKNCKAVMMIAVNDNAGTFTTMNVYNDNLPASFRPEIYTYAIKQPKLDRKLEEMREIEVDEFPPFVTNAAGRKRSRKTK